MGIIIKCRHGAEKIIEARRILLDFDITSYAEHNYEEYTGIEILFEDEKLDNFLSSEYYDTNGFIKTE